MPTNPGTGTEAGDFARSVSGSGDPTERLQRGVELAVELLEGCDHAGVTIVAGGRLDTPAASDDVVRQGDAWQYELNEGPCLDSVALEHTVISQDLNRDGRWPRWSARVQDRLGVSSMMSLLLFTDRDVFGALNLYGDRPGVWASQQAGLAYSLAGHLATSVADALEIDHRGRAMLSRTVIGQAEGIVMERFGVTAEKAFAYLRRISQTTNRKLVDIATDIASTRRLPTLPGHPATSSSTGAGHER